MQEEKLVNLCKKGKSSAQKELYDELAPRLRGVCRRYIADIDDAEDVLQDGFVRIFTQVEKFSWQGDGSLFYWTKRVMINVALNYLKKNKNRVFDESLTDEMDLIDTNDDGYFDNIHTKYSREDVMNAMGRVPQQFRIVLNMAVIDDMKHREICELLNIAEETSRSRLTRAKQLFRMALLEKVKDDVAI